LMHTVGASLCLTCPTMGIETQKEKIYDARVNSHPSNLGLTSTNSDR
jgi:hypothetical protein